MERTTSQKRPWLAALLGALVTGFGHLYLRRWRRAVGWLAVLFAVSYAFVDPAAIEALAAGEPVDPLSIAPTLLVGSLSVIDAYVLARAQNEVARTRARPSRRRIRERRSTAVRTAARMSIRGSTSATGVRPICRAVRRLISRTPRANDQNGAERNLPERVSPERRVDILFCGRSRSLVLADVVEHHRSGTGAVGDRHQ